MHARALIFVLYYCILYIIYLQSIAAGREKNICSTCPTVYLFLFVYTWRKAQETYRKINFDFCRPLLLYVDTFVLFVSLVPLSSPSSLNVVAELICKQQLAALFVTARPSAFRIKKLNRLTLYLPFSFNLI